MGYFAVMAVISLIWMAHASTITSCTTKTVKHTISGEAEIRMVAEQRICTEANGFKTDEQKRDCIMGFLDCRKKIVEGEDNGE